MSPTQTEQPTIDLKQKYAETQRAMPAFVPLERASQEQHQYAKTLASAFLKFHTAAKQLTELDSVQNFVAMARLHQQLTQDMVAFLQAKVAFVYEDKPIQPILEAFAEFRLAQLNTAKQAALVQQDQTALEQLNVAIRDAQADYEAVTLANQPVSFA